MLKSVYKYVAKASRTYGIRVAWFLLVYAEHDQLTLQNVVQVAIRLENKEGNSINHGKGKRALCEYYLYVCARVMKLTTLVLKRVLTKAIVYYLFFGLIHIY